MSEVGTPAPSSSARPTTMFCADCDVTWRGQITDECWSCGESGDVRQATPRRVRLTPVTTEADRLVS
ncbi:MAG: hypothetical protein AAF567_10845 [Actinomycetota bacterium]